MTVFFSRPFSLEEATKTSPESEAIFADTGVRIHPWERVFSKNIANVAIKIYRLIGEYVNIWLGDINPEYWTRGTLQSLHTLLLHALSHIDEPNQRKGRLSQIKAHLMACAFADAWRGMKPTLHPRHLQNARLLFSIPHHQDPTDKTTADESDKSEANPSIPTPERPRTNSVTRKDPATEPFLETSPKQSRWQEIAVSVTTGDNTELRSTDCDLIPELKQHQDGAKDSFLKLLHRLPILSSTAVGELGREREITSDRIRSLNDDMANAKESLTKLKDSVSTLMADMEAHAANEKELQSAKNVIEAAGSGVRSTVWRVHEKAKSNTSATLEEKSQELEEVKARLGRLIEEVEEAQA
ncbi:uncharacterized protein FMAN_14903 [Fusarium mangiferae]|uniref:Uncharacterized protein n=1 Tax=Fusarium mangiferae TaxID=192010 RepID=A0A1L7U8C2_FUSMA|nr:uncharacterized protein FMAN_14903 [Fusarium mangiferae]CVL03967.1 uncharacterized protein FMAN_14903 [Fusarium mangiferae]